MKDLKTVSSDNPDISRLQSNLDVWAKSVKFDGVNDGVLLNGVALLSSGTNYVEHRLGREPRGWFAMPQANSVIWSEQATNTFKTKSLALACSADVIADIWIF